MERTKNYYRLCDERRYYDDVIDIFVRAFNPIYLRTGNNNKAENTPTSRKKPLLTYFAFLFLIAQTNAQQCRQPEKIALPSVLDWPPIKSAAS